MDELVLLLSLVPRPRIILHSYDEDGPTLHQFLLASMCSRHPVRPSGPHLPRPKHHRLVPSHLNIGSAPSPSPAQSPSPGSSASSPVASTPPNCKNTTNRTTSVSCLTKRATRPASTKTASTPAKAPSTAATTGCMCSASRAL